MAFLSKKEELTLAEFIDSYENYHIPLVLSLAATPPIYKRRYLSVIKSSRKAGNLLIPMRSRSWALPMQKHFSVTGRSHSCYWKRVGSSLQKMKSDSSNADGQKPM